MTTTQQFNLVEGFVINIDELESLAYRYFLNRLYHEWDQFKGNPTDLQDDVEYHEEGRGAVRQLANHRPSQQRGVGRIFRSEVVGRQSETPGFARPKCPTVRRSLRKDKNYEWHQHRPA